MAIDDNTSYELTGYQVKDLAQKVRAKADSASLASVATSGLYSDLTGAPTIPTVYNGTLTIQHNGTSKGTFTANQSSASTVNIETIYADDYIDTTSALPFVTTSMIENNAVTAAKIDWSSMPAPIVITTSSNITRNTSSAWATEDFYSEQKTFDAGKYLILAMFRIANSSSGDKWIDVKVGNTGDLCNQGFQSGTGAMQGVAAFDFIDIKTSGTYAVTFQAGSEANNAAMVLCKGSKIALIKIG